LPPEGTECCRTTAQKTREAEDRSCKASRGVKKSQRTVACEKTYVPGVPAQVYMKDSAFAD